MEWPGSHILFLNSCPLISDSQALLTRPLEPWSAKFSTSEPASPARSGVFSSSVRLGELLRQTWPSEGATGGPARSVGSQWVDLTGNMPF